MTDEQLQRRINRQFDVDSIKSKAALIFAGLLGISILLAYVVST